MSIPAMIDQVRNARLKLLFDTLAAAGITQVNVTFDGSGDSGQIEGMTIEPDTIGSLPEHGIRWVHGTCTWEPAPNPTAEAGTLIPYADKKWSFDPKIGNLNDLLEDIVYDYMDREHSGWENNDGAFGQFMFDVQERTVRYEHNTRFTDSWRDTHEYKLEE